VNDRISVLIPFERASALAAEKAAGEAVASGAGEVLLVGEGPINPPMGARYLRSAGGRGRAIRDAVPTLQTQCTVISEPWVNGIARSFPVFAEPIGADRADVVLPRGTSFNGRALAERFAREISDLPLEHPLAPVRAVRTSALQSLRLVSDGPGIAAEILVKLAAQSFRFSEVEIERQDVRSTPASLAEVGAFLGTLFRYAFLTNEADNMHEGYNTLERLEAAPHYNAWLGSKLRPHIGRRVLEVGAGIGTITRQIEAGRERVIALEADAYYAQRLSNLFRGSKVVTPIHAPVEQTDWHRLSGENLDTVLLSNVLEHIDDDGAAVRSFRSVLSTGGRLVLLVPALPALFGTLDQAVGHHRRYTPDALRSVLETNGFSVEVIEWLNFVGIAGWFLNGKVLRRRVLPPVQLRLYDRLAPLLARAEGMWKLPVGLSLLAVARAAEPGATG
jgi:SAM-dependent methyltransferase